MVLETVPLPQQADDSASKTDSERECMVGRDVAEEDCDSYCLSCHMSLPRNELVKLPSNSEYAKKYNLDFVCPSCHRDIMRMEEDKDCTWWRT